MIIAISMVVTWFFLGLFGWMLLANQLYVRINNQKGSNILILVPRRKKLIMLGPFGLLSAVVGICTLSKENRHWGLRFSIY